jgi:hypothetical protein
MWLKRNTRTCPSPHIVEKILQETTDFQGQIRSNDKVCYSCYKSHLVSLEGHTSAAVSVDSNLQELLSNLSATLSTKKITSIDDLVDHAMIRTTIDVGNKLLDGEAMLLPTINDMFNAHIKYLVHTEGLEYIIGKEIGDNLVTSRWILIQLSSALYKHLSSTCKIRKCGTLVYRKNADLPLIITQLLWKQKSSSTESTASHQVNTLPASEQNETSDKLTTTVLTDLNSRIHISIRSLLAEDSKAPFDYSKLNINDFLAKVGTIGQQQFNL